MHHNQQGRVKATPSDYNIQFLKLSAKKQVLGYITELRKGIKQHEHLLDKAMVSKLSTELNKIVATVKVKKSSTDKADKSKIKDAVKLLATFSNNQTYKENLTPVVAMLEKNEIIPKNAVGLITQTDKIA